MAIARRTVDGHAAIHQALAGRVDIVDLIGQMPEEAVLAIGLLVPIVGEFNQRGATRLRQLLEQIVFALMRVNGETFVPKDLG